MDAADTREFNELSGAEHQNTAETVASYACQLPWALHREKALDAFVASGCHCLELETPSQLNAVFVVDRALASSSAFRKYESELLPKYLHNTHWDKLTNRLA